MTDQPFESPQPGWYADPVTGTGYRWWNGTAWTDTLSATVDGAGGGLGGVGDWLTETFRLLTRRAGHIFTMIAILVLPSSLLSVLALWQLIGDARITGLNDSDGPEFIGFDTSGLVGLGFSVVLQSVTTVWLAASVARHAERARAEDPEPWSASMIGGLARLPRALGSGLLYVVILTVALVVVSVVIGLVGASLPILLIVAIPAAVVAMLAVWIRFGFAITSASVAPRGVWGVTTSWRISDGHTFALMGRYVLLFLIATTLSFGSLTVTGPIAALSGTEPIEAGADEIAVSQLLGDNPAGFAASQLVSSLFQGVVLALFATASLVLYRRLNGPVEARPDPS